MTVPGWLEQALPELVFWGTLLGLATLLLIIFVVPMVIDRLPPDYFSEPRRHSLRKEAHGASVWLLPILKNLLGAVMVCLGLVMLFTPGQGLVTLLVGMLLMNFPGKYRLERSVVRREGVLRALNWFRQRRGRPPFEPPAS